MAGLTKLPFSSVWSSGIFELKVISNHKAIMQILGNFLDFANKARSTGLFKLTYHVQVKKELSYNAVGVPLPLVAAIKAGAILLSLSNGDGKAFAAVHLKDRRVDAVVEGFGSIKLESLADFLFFQPLRRVALEQGYVALHASVVQRGKTVFLITGPQNTGKSTMAASLVRGGFSLLADDDCFFKIVRHQLKLYPFATKMGFKEGGVARFKEFQPFLVEGYTYGQKKRFSLTHLYAAPKPSYAQVVILFPSYTKVKHLKFKLLGSDQVLERMIKGNLPRRWRKEMPKHYFESFLALRDLVKMSRAYEALYHDGILDELGQIRDGQL